MSIKKEPDDNPNEGDIWFKEDNSLYRYTNGRWELLIDSSSQPTGVFDVDQWDVPQKTSETHSIIPWLCLGILVSLIVLMLLLTIL